MVKKWKMVIAIQCMVYYHIQQILQSLYCHLLQISHCTTTKQNLITWYRMQIRLTIKCVWSQSTGLYFTLLESLECLTELLHGAENLEEWHDWGAWSTVLILPVSGSLIELCVVVRCRVLSLLHVSVSSRLTNYQMCGAVLILSAESCGIDYVFSHSIYVIYIFFLCYHEFQLSLQIGFMQLYLIIFSDNNSKIDLELNLNLFRHKEN